ncbi:hypothetical protein H6P81_005831 [Aristolochia fimbriata]|uniref:Uncharacterized protein n=1 Tax=Aristolochia fimbriata TaxID=158543 RepID=A0AAV7EZG2_ARIFI|nr:hypothetical protein H6P81_005831 [Aristolochia fimbriata]
MDDKHCKDAFFAHHRKLSGAWNGGEAALRLEYVFGEKHNCHHRTEGETDEDTLDVSFFCGEKQYSDAKILYRSKKFKKKKDREKEERSHVNDKILVCGGHSSSSRRVISSSVTPILVRSCSSLYTETVLTEAHCSDEAGTRHRRTCPTSIFK